MPDALPDAVSYQVLDPCLQADDPCPGRRTLRAHAVEAGLSLSEPERRGAGPGNLAMTSKRETSADGSAERAFARMLQTLAISKPMAFTMRTIIFSTTTVFPLRLD